jgi:hypothetical protein
MSHVTRPASSLSVLPDAVTGHEAVIVLAAIVQLAILSSPVMYVGLRRYRQYQVELTARQERIQQVDAKWHETFARWQAKHGDEEKQTRKQN